MLKYQNLLIWLFLSITTGYCAEQGSIEGRICDESTGLGLKGVNVVILHSNMGASSDDDGYYQISNLAPGKYALRFSAIGYKKIVIDSVFVIPDKVTSIRVSLVPTVIRLNQIVVTAAKQEQLLEDTPDLTIIKTADEIRSMCASQVNDIIEFMPGINSVGGTGSGQPFKRAISINGMPAYYSLILLDGKRVLSSHIHTGANVNIISPEHIERIELVKGAMSAQYGTDGMGGVLNIITRKGSDHAKLNFTSYGGSQKTYHNGLSIAGAISTRIKHSLFSSWEQSDGQPIIEPEFRKNKLSYSKLQLMDRLDADFSDNFKASASIYYMNIETPYKETPNLSTLFTPHMTFEYKVFKNISILASGYYSRWESQLNDELNEITSPELMISFNHFKNHNLLFGADLIYRNFARKRVAEHDQHTYGMFLQDDFSISSSWHILTAIRLDKVDNITPVLSPKLSILYRMNSKVSCRASIGRGFRAPSVQDLYETLYSHPGNIHYRAGNPELDPEYSTTFLGGIDFKLTDHLSLMLNGYYYSIDNMITPVDHGLEEPTLYFSPDQIPFITDSLAYIYRKENIHQGMIFGGEVEMLWQFLPGYMLESGINLTHNENRDTGQSLPYYPGKSFSLKVRGRQRINSNFEIGGFIGLNATMDRKVWTFKHDSEQQFNLDNYQKLDAGLSLFFKNGYELFVNADNLLGQELHLYEDVSFIIKGIAQYRAGLRLSIH